MAIPGDTPHQALVSTASALDNWPKPDPDRWPEPDLSVLRLRRRPPPALAMFGSAWGAWIGRAAAAACCPPDYVAAPLVASVSALIGHARWAQATPGWIEPPHLWVGVVGDSGNGKSPGADCLMREVLPEIERRMLADFPDRLCEWRAAAEFAKAARERWLKEVRGAERFGALFARGCLCRGFRRALVHRDRGRARAAHRVGVAHRPQSPYSMPIHTGK